MLYYLRHSFHTNNKTLSLHCCIYWCILCISYSHDWKNFCKTSMEWVQCVLVFYFQVDRLGHYVRSIDGRHSNCIGQVSSSYCEGQRNCNRPKYLSIHIFVQSIWAASRGILIICLSTWYSAQRSKSSSNIKIFIEHIILG